ncbi:MAG TPA: DUF2141 domain-containing protein [Fibrobacteria bacterium]|nr:DUF2141 domain-containing protein [Fibrobacteria bacterium]
MHLLVLLASLWAGGASAPAKLEVELTGVLPGGGNVVVQIFDDQATFFKKPLVSRVVPADAPRLEVAFDLPEGEYAVAAYQDKNGNGVLDHGLFHIPSEPYGLSNNFRPKWSKPKFDDCKIEVAGKVVSHIALK